MNLVGESLGFESLGAVDDAVTTIDAVAEAPMPWLLLASKLKLSFPEKPAAGV
jgi:hypothetical protein